MELPALLPEFAKDMGALATHRLFAACFKRDDQAAASLAEFLLSLYDARVGKLDTYMLCRSIDAEHFDDVITVLQWFRFAENGFDVHHVFGKEQGARMMRNLIRKLATQFTPLI